MHDPQVVNKIIKYNCQADLSLISWSFFQVYWWYFSDAMNETLSISVQAKNLSQLSCTFMQMTCVRHFSQEAFIIHCLLPKTHQYKI